MKWTENEIGASGAMKICEALLTNNTLTTLYLGGDDKVIIWKEKKQDRNWNRNERIEENKMEWNEQITR